jgi:hypothetical protein
MRSAKAPVSFKRVIISFIFLLFWLALSKSA